MNVTRRAAAAVLLAAALALAAPVSAGAAGGPSAYHQDLAAARAATAAMHSTDNALEAGYLPPPDGSVLDACITLPDAGMGVHWVDPEAMTDNVADPAQPEMLVYEPTARGDLRLVAVEYVVPQAEWDAVHADPPELFGHEMHVVSVPTLEPFYALHAWIFKHNPWGMHADFNPRVSCEHWQG